MPAAVRKSRAAAVEVAAALVGFAAPQVGEHRVGPQRDRAAVGLDGAERLLVAQGGVAPGEQRAVVALARRRLVGEGGAHGGQRQHGDDEAIARFTAAYANSRGELSGRGGLNWI